MAVEPHAEQRQLTQYIARRIVHAVFVVWAVATLVFFLLQMIPGDPVAHILGEEYSPEAAEALRERLGLDQPLLTQYLNWIGHAATGDFGRSIATGETVSGAIASALPKTLSLAILSFMISLLIAVPAGVISALKRNSLVDYGVSVFAYVGVSMPSYWFGILLVVVFAVNLGWFPAIGYTSISEGGVGEWFNHLLLPAIACGAAYSAILMRFVRAGLLEVLGNEYIRTARAKGLPERAVISRHALRNALVPVVTVAGIQFALLLNGAVVIEVVFSIRGVGRLLINGIFDRDYPIVQGVILLVAAMFVTVNLLVDIAYTFLDPRIRYG